MSEQPVSGPADDGPPTGTEVAEAPATCTFPTGPEEDPDLTLCGRPRKTKKPGTRGPAPEYCDDPKHTPLRAHRRRASAEKRKAGVPVIPPQALTLDPDRAVTDSATAMAVVRTRWNQALDERAAFLERSNSQLSEILDHAAELADVMDDPAKASAEIAHIRKQAEAEISTATSRADKAERAERKAREELAAAIEVRDEAVAELEALEETTERRLAEAGTEVEQAKADAARVVQEAQDEAERLVREAQAAADAVKKQVERDRDEILERRQVEHDRLVAEIREQAAQDVTAAKTAADTRVAEIKAEAEGLVAEAQADAAEARVEAEDAAKELELVKQAAAKDAAAAEAAQDQVKEVRADLKTARDEVAALRTRLEDKDTEHRQVVKDLETRYEGQLTDLRTRLETQAAEYRRDVERLETRHEQQLQRERAGFEQERTRIDQANQEALTALRAQVQTLTEALETARTSTNAAETAGTTDKKGTRR